MNICILEKNNDELNVTTNNKYKLIETSKINFDLSPLPYEHWTIKEINEQYDALI